MQFIQVIVFRTLLAICTTSGITGALHFSSIQMPALVQRGANFWLACHFELAADEQLYSIKWYKNNEEFYRLLATSGATNPAGQTAAAEAAESADKQYFTQAGVNVLMSGSNATHVRLLNASLESEGAYACEISGENLSTIRHEREIKVYVLPHQKLSLIGLRTFYSAGERVELLCSGDLSRPAGALAWFINGQRITTNSRPLFELEAKKAAGPQQLARVSLALKFTLTNELLVGGVGGGGGADGNQSVAGGRNQSWKLSSRAGRPLELLRLECRFKLTDVSDVTFSELKVAPPPASRTPQQLVRPAKSQDGRRLVEASAAPHGQPDGRDACQRGPLALQPDDPIILRAHESPHRDNRQPQQQQQQEAATLNLNCSTLAAALGPQLEAPSEVATAEAEVWPPALERSKLGPHTNNKLAPLCSDPAARRRALISGKYQTADEQQLSAARGAKLRNNQLVAYVRLADEQARLVMAAASSSVAAESAGAQVTKSLAQLEAPARWASGVAWQLRAPPLLEWFINNREAPKSSASYSPELPLLPASSGARQLDGEPALLPSVDYAQYFANFDSLRPLDQHLRLSLKLDERHFQTADSQLTLRCTSTQAQVLMLDSASVSLQLAADEGQAHSRRAGSAHWQQRPLAANNQIKPKYLHQQPRASNQRLGAAPSSRAVPSVVRSCASPPAVAELPSLVLLCLSVGLLLQVNPSGWLARLH